MLCIIIKIIRVWFCLQLRDVLNVSIMAHYRFEKPVTQEQRYSQSTWIVKAVLCMRCLCSVYEHVQCLPSIWRAALTFNTGPILVSWNCVSTKLQSSNSAMCQSSPTFWAVQARENVWSSWTIREDITDPWASRNVTDIESSSEILKYNINPLLPMLGSVLL